MQTSIELLKEIEAFLCFNTHPSKKEIQVIKQSIREHIEEIESENTDDEDTTNDFYDGGEENEETDEDKLFPKCDEH